MNPGDTSTTKGAYPTSIPTTLTSFIGRKHELAAVARLLVSSRLVTLTGEAGCGKTRLAMRIASELSDQFAHGVHWVGLAALDDPHLVPQAMAKEMHVTGQAGRPLLEALLDNLREKQLLLVLDNCEHLINACRRLVEAILLGVPNVRVLATSRELLGVPGETRFLVQPMALPPANLRGEDIGEFDAVQLFLERVCQVPNL